ncbi:MAG: trypsin-like peptidase domain-containing protein [Acidobacteria bacterium]|nr:trypsin-like peptidase domain-containing protein [Acidobacteriota bacterium]
MVVVLTHLSGGQSGQTEVLEKDRIRLGRALDNDVIFTSQDLRASAHHGEILREGDQYVVQDLQSTNGTYVNGARVERTTLRDGHIIQLGRKGPQLLFEVRPRSEIGQLNQKPWTKGTTISQSARLMVEPVSEPLGGRSRRFGLQTMQLAIETAVNRSSSGWRRLVVILTLLTVAALGAALYMAVIGPSPSVLSPAESAKIFSSIAERNQSAVVLIRLQFELVDQQGDVISEGTNEGTGFAVDPRGYIATNFHIVQPWEFDEQLKKLHAQPRVRSLTVIFADHTSREAIPATLYRGSKESDVAILAITPPPEMPLVKGIETDISTVHQGDEVAFIGFPYGSDLLSTTRQDRATTTFKRTTVSKVARDLIQLDTSIQTGYSGSPIFNRDGKVIGVVTAEIKDNADSESLSIGLGTPIKFAMELLGEG